MPQIAVKLSSASFSRLKRLAWQGQATYANIIESALAVYQPETSELANPIPDDLQSAINAALAPVLSRLAAIEAMMQSGTAQDGQERALNGQGIAEQPIDANVPEIAAEDVQGDVGTETDIPLHPVRCSPKLTVHEYVANLIAAGERSPAQIARALNKAGYRTGTGTEYVRSSTVITNPLKAVDDFSENYKTASVSG